MRPFLEHIEQTGFFSQIRNSAYAYPILLWLHIVALMAWGGMMLLTDLRFLGVFFADQPVSRLMAGLRWPKRVTFVIAALCGLLLFGAKAAEYDYNPWFWVKVVLIALLGVNYLLFRRDPSDFGRLKFAAGLSLVLWIGAIGAARGPATVKDIMHSMVDPSGDFLFQSVQLIGDDTGSHEIAPQTQAQWDDVEARVRILISAPDILSKPDRRAARPRDRSKNSAVENEPAEVQALLDAHRADFAQHARKLGEAANVTLQAVQAKDKDALLNALNGIDQACEVCHLLYWYPKDQRATQAAREAGLIP